MYTISKLAKLFNLSRHALLYYDSLAAALASYRNQLPVIFRSRSGTVKADLCVGLPLESIRAIVNQPGLLTASVLEKRLGDLAARLVLTLLIIHLSLSRLRSGSFFKKSA